jgi:hypothetical protein
MIDQRSSGTVLERRARECQAEVPFELAGDLGLARGGVLDVLRFVEHDAVEGDVAHDLFVALQQVVARQHDVVLLDDRAELFGRRGASLAVVQHDVEAGAEAVDLAAPVAEHRDRTHDQDRGLALTLLAPVEHHRDRLHGLAEAHVVGEARAKTLSTRKCIHAWPRAW